MKIGALRNLKTYGVIVGGGVVRSHVVKCESRDSKACFLWAFGVAATCLGVSAKILSGKLSRQYLHFGM